MWKFSFSSLSDRKCFLHWVTENVFLTGWRKCSLHRVKKTFSVTEWRKWEFLHGYFSDFFRIFSKMTRNDEIRRDFIILEKWKSFSQSRHSVPLLLRNLAIKLKKSSLKACPWNLKIQNRWLFHKVHSKRKFHMRAWSYSELTFQKFPLL